MHIFNVMLSRGLGGIEAAFLRYVPLLQSLGHRVTCVVHPGAEIAHHLPEGVDVLTLAHRSQWDIGAVLQARWMLQKHRPDAVISHVKRGLVLFGLARQGLNIPLVQILHRPRYGYLWLADSVLCVNPTMVTEAVGRGIARSKLAYVPNFLLDSPNAPVVKASNTPPIIGVAARMVPEKGLDLFLDALALLKGRGMPFAAHIGGDGSLRTALQAQAGALGLSPHLQWKGWVEDMDGFIAEVDVVCSPSRLESFGLATLGAMRAGKPIVATRTVGSSHLITHGFNGLLCEVDASSLADGLARMVGDPVKAHTMAMQAREDARAYSMSVVGLQVQACLERIRFK